MARALIVGCGRRGRALGAELAARDWQVRGTSRSDEGLAAIGEAGLDPARASRSTGDGPRSGRGRGRGRLAAGSADGGREELAAIHGSRLERLLERLVDTPVRGFAYEDQGSAPSDLLDGGRAIVEQASLTWRIPATTLGSGVDGSWASGAADAIERLLEP